MTQTIKKGDPILIVGYNSILMEGLISEDVSVTEQDNPRTIVLVDNGWVIGSQECSLVKGSPYTKGFFPDRAKVVRAINKKGYYWQITLETVIPKKTKKKKK